MALLLEERAANLTDTCHVITPCPYNPGYVSLDESVLHPSYTDELESPIEGLEGPSHAN